MTKVYIVNAGGHDCSSAKFYGELVVCTEGSLNKYDINQMYRELNTALTNSEENDLILLTSLTSLCCVACTIFAVKHRKLNLLIHRMDKDGKDSYVQRTISFKDKDEPIQR